MLRAVAEDAEDGADLVNRIEWLFTDNEDKDASLILCSSVHKAKGLEADRVYILQDTLYLRGPSQEEDNIYYVAQTRAKGHLTMVSGLR
jgi:superfamily I DNA/RNA helicase